MPSDRTRENRFQVRKTWYTAFSFLVRPPHYFLAVAKGQAAQRRAFRHCFCETLLRGHFGICFPFLWWCLKICVLPVPFWPSAPFFPFESQAEFPDPHGKAP